MSPAGDAYLIRGDLDAQIEELYSFHITYSLTGAGSSQSARFDGEHLTYTSTSSPMKCNYSGAVLKKSLNKGAAEVVSGANISAKLNGSDYTSNAEITSMLDSSTTPTVRVSATENGIERAAQSNTYKYYTPDVLVLVPDDDETNFDLTTYKSLYKTHCQTNQTNLKTVDWNNGMRIAYISTDSKPSSFDYNLPSDATTQLYKYYFITTKTIDTTKPVQGSDGKAFLTWTISQYQNKTKLFNVTPTTAETQAKITEPELYIYYIGSKAPGGYKTIIL